MFIVQQMQGVAGIVKGYKFIGLMRCAGQMGTHKGAALIAVINDQNFEILRHHDSLPDHVSGATATDIQICKGYKLTEGHVFRSVINLGRRID